MLVSDNRGFTLLEILIAITLLVFITLGVVNITQDATRTMERTTEINKNNLQIETALSRLEWDFSQIYSPLYFSTTMKIGQFADDETDPDPSTPPVAPAAPISPQVQAYFEQTRMRLERNENFKSISKEALPIPRFHSPEKNILEFMTTSNRRKLENVKQSHFAWVRYSLSDKIDKQEEENHPDIPSSTKNLVRYFVPDDPYGEKRIDVEDEEKVKGAVLLENVESLEFQFWHFEKRKWETSLKAIPDGESIIRGVQVMITWYDSNGQKRTITKVFRPLWPIVTPKDPEQGARPPTAGGAQGGATTGGDQDDS